VKCSFDRVRSTFLNLTMPQPCDEATEKLWSPGNTAQVNATRSLRCSLVLVVDGGGQELSSCAHVSFHTFKLLLLTGKGEIPL